MEDHSRSKAKNPYALETAQDASECFEIYEPPPEKFDPCVDKPVSKNIFTTRGQAHKNGCWHCSVHIWIVDTTSKSILLQKRSVNKDTFPGRVSTQHMSQADDCYVLIAMIPGST
jgi:hypothetical protein